MNIFFLDKDPKKSAQYLVNSHVVKLITEHNQLLSAAHHLHPDNDYDQIKDKIYKLTHKNHPCAKWVRACTANYLWLVHYNKELCIEYTYRYEKRHKGEDILDTLMTNTPHIPFSMKMTIPPCAMDDQFKVYKEPKNLYDVIDNYRNYYIKGKSHLHKWKNREVPEWIKNVNM